jgi:hypothetical protein
MSITLRPEVRARVKDALARALSTVGVGNYISMSFAFMAVDAGLPKTGPLRAQLARYLDDFPFSEFVNDVLTEEFQQRSDFQSESGRKLTELPGYEDPSVAAEDLIRRFETLPWSYKLTAPFPHKLHDLIPADADDFELGPNLRICRATPEFQERYPLATDHPAINQRLLPPTGLINPHPPGAKAQWESNEVYFQIDAEGFIGRYAYSPTTSAAEGLLRSFFGLGLASDLFQSHSYLLSYSRPIPVYIHRATRAGTWEPVTRYDLSESVTRGIRSLYLGHPNDALRILPKNAQKVATDLARIRAILALGEEADQTRLASQWLFDGSTGSDPLLTFVQSMVVMEILLGEKSASDEIGISTLISNRYAYLVGRTHDERADLIATFKKIYAVRSQIVHSGKQRLRNEDLQLLRQLQWMGRAVIAKELDMLLAPKQQ